MFLLSCKFNKKKLMKNSLKFVKKKNFVLQILKTSIIL